MIETNEIQQLVYIFPNLEYLKIDAENCLETTINVKGLSKLNKLILEVKASEEYKGEVDSTEEDPDFKF